MTWVYGVSASCPKLSTPGSRLLTEGVEAVFAEAFRAVRTNVQFSYDDGGGAQHIGRSLVVTSTAPSEGKTLVASNLAVGLAMAGQRVVLIDADMRRPTVHEIFQQSQEPGLSNLIAGTISASQAFCESGVRGLWLVPSGTMPTNPAELLSSPRFRDILKTLCAHYDWVIIDSPPAMAVIDASVIAHVAGGVLFVVSSENTSRPAAIKALEQLDAAKANFVGAVLNRVDMKRNAYFYSPYLSSRVQRVLLANGLNRWAPRCRRSASGSRLFPTRIELTCHSRCGPLAVGGWSCRWDPADVRTVDVDRHVDGNILHRRVRASYALDQFLSIQ